MLRCRLPPRFIDAVPDYQVMHFRHDCTVSGAFRAVNVESGDESYLKVS